MTNQKLRVINPSSSVIALVTNYNKNSADFSYPVTKRKEKPLPYSKLNYCRNDAVMKLGSRSDYAARRVVILCDLCLVFKRFPQFLLNIYQEHWGHDTIKVIQSKHLFLWCQVSIRQKQILKKSLLFFPGEALMNRCNILSRNGWNFLLIAPCLFKLKHCIHDSKRPIEAEGVILRKNIYIF